jgi:hypothetical protein
MKLNGLSKLEHENEVAWKFRNGNEVQAQR